ncbi:hypothetical protein HL658_10090 [Azospirillum sp. RWY-5-1]|uniref:Uncharacterized protein n=1 Tax=Azospirillum oleiclasticum TaxID=2735135 RepID=A0ABX2T9D5_9PROT|nr:hypothetical protein [Azospirillum oleiclasticum]NYZ12902.1 hypothetical protein [Azospirillum oleiclasticum]NYZ20425.1 hypothetical protein [Azospirillum oleiclasticum]
MTEPIDVTWWITAVELPALAGLFWLILRQRRESEDALESLRARAEAAQAQVRESLAAYKLEVAKTYVSTGTLKDVETRLTDHLLRIERKLEGAAPAGEIRR